MTLIKFNRPGKQYVSPLWNNVFNDFFHENSALEQANFVPAVNILEKPTSFEIHISAPGFVKENFKIAVENDLLSVSGEHKAETTEENFEKKYTRKEFAFGSFKRSWALPENVNSEDIKAVYENGILKLEIPKLTEEKVITTREIKIG